jgi:hypothetical protein
MVLAKSEWKMHVSAFFTSSQAFYFPSLQAISFTIKQFLSSFRHFHIVMSIFHFPSGISISS